MNHIEMAVQAIDWTEGNVGHVHVLLDDGNCRIAMSRLDKMPDNGRLDLK